MFSLGLLIIFVFLAWKAAPRERAEDAHIHGAGQIGLLAAVALFGVDYFTSYFYATGELMSALHPYGIQKYAYVGVAFIALANFVFGALYLYAIGIFNEGGGSYTAAMRYLTPGLSLVVAVVLIQDYTLTIVVSALSGGDQLLSILNLYGRNWAWHFMIGASLAAVTWYLTIRGRGESLVRHVRSAGRLRPAYGCDGSWPVHGAQPRRDGGADGGGRASYRPSGALPHADGHDERYRRSERAGSRVERHPVLQA